MRSLFSIILMIITGLNIFAQSSKEIYLRAQESYYSQDYQGSLKKLRTVQIQLNTSNAVIEHLKVKCYFELEEYDKAKRALKEFSKYKAGEPLVQEMAQYQKRIRQLQKEKALSELNKEQENGTLIFQKITSEVLSEKKSLEKRLKTENRRLTLLPFAKKKYNVITKSLKAISSIEEGRFYYFKDLKSASGKHPELILFCYYDNRYLLLKIPKHNAYRRLDKDKVRFTSRDAQLLINEGFGGIYSPKTKTNKGKFPMYFLGAGPNASCIIGGQGDAVLQNPLLDNYNYLELYYYIWGDYLFVNTMHQQTAFDLDLANINGVYNPSIETGEIVKLIDKYLTTSDYQDSLVNISNFEEFNSANINSKEISKFLKIKLAPKGTEKVIAPYKEVYYTPSQRMYSNNLSVYQDKRVVDKWRSFTYYSVSGQNTYYLTLDKGKNIESDNILRNLHELDSRSIAQISKSDFNSLYEAFSRNLGTGVSKKFSNTNYTLPMNVFMSLPRDIQSLDESIIINTEFMSRNYSDNGILTSEGLKKGDQYIGYWKFYSDQGIKIMEGAYNNNEPHGKWLYYSTETGDYGQTRMYDEGKLMNILENVDPKGHPQDYGTLKDGYGTVKYIDEDGILESVYRYEEGKKISYLYNNGASSYPQNTENKEVFFVTDKRPSFPGGRQAKIEYIKKNTQYPEEVKKKGIEGFVVVYFIIEKDGSIKYMNVRNSLHPKLDAEALRIIKDMPKWSAGEREGSPVRSLEYIPVWFRL